MNDEKKAELKRMKKELKTLRAEIVETRELKRRIDTVEQRAFYADRLAEQIAELEGGESDA